MAKVRKAVITAAGKGTRQYPASTAVQKEMFPLVDRDGLTKPVIQIIGEEAIESREAEQPMPFDRLEQKEAAGFLLRIVATLPARQQEVIQLKFQNDLSYQQIAKIMKTTANNVGVLLHTALKTLRQRYGQIAGDFIPFKPRTTE